MLGDVPYLEWPLPVCVTVMLHDNGVSLVFLWGRPLANGCI